jgi:hypothetical protein
MPVRFDPPAGISNKDLNAEVPGRILALDEGQVLNVPTGTPLPKAEGLCVQRLSEDPERTIVWWEQPWVRRECLSRGWA